MVLRVRTEESGGREWPVMHRCSLIRSHYCKRKLMHYIDPMVKSIILTEHHDIHAKMVIPEYLKRDHTSRPKPWDDGRGPHGTEI